jgi:hypothetical protein
MMLAITLPGGLNGPSSGMCHAFPPACALQGSAGAPRRKKFVLQRHVLLGRDPP